MSVFNKILDIKLERNKKNINHSYIRLNDDDILGMFDEAIEQDGLKGFNVWLEVYKDDRSLWVAKEILKEGFTLFGMAILAETPRFTKVNGYD